MNRAIRRHLTLRKQIQRVNRLRFCERIHIQSHLSERQVGRLRDTVVPVVPKMFYKGMDRHMAGPSIHDGDEPISEPKAVKAKVRSFIEAWLTEGLAAGNISDVRHSLAEVAMAFEEFRTSGTKSTYQWADYNDKEEALWSLLMEFSRTKNSVSA